MTATDAPLEVTVEKATPPGRSPLSFVAHGVTHYGLLIAWAIVIIVFTILEPGRFMTSQSFGNMFGSQAVLVIMSLGLMAPVIAGEWDLSIAANVGISMTLVGSLNVNHHWPILLAVVVGILASTLVGCVNAFFIVVAEVPSLIATLGMGTLLDGLIYAISNTTIAGYPDGFVSLGQHRFLSIQLPFYLAIALAFVAWYLLRWTPAGRYLYFVGSSWDVSKLSGIRVDRVRAAALVVAAFVAGIAGVTLTATLGAAGPGISDAFLLPTFAAIYLGSTVLTPGRINVWGAVIAVYFLITGVTGMQLLGAQSWVQNVFYGAVLVVAVALSRLGKKRATLRV